MEHSSVLSAQVEIELAFEVLHPERARRLADVLSAATCADPRAHNFDPRSYCTDSRMLTSSVLKGAMGHGHLVADLEEGTMDSV